MQYCCTAALKHHPPHTPPQPTFKEQLLKSCSHTLACWRRPFNTLSLFYLSLCASPLLWPFCTWATNEFTEPVVWASPGFLSIRSAALYLIRMLHRKRFALKERQSGFFFLSFFLLFLPPLRLYLKRLCLMFEVVNVTEDFKTGEQRLAVLKTSEGRRGDMLFLPFQRESLWPSLIIRDEGCTGRGDWDC